MSDIIQDIICDIPFKKFLKNAKDRKIVIWGKGKIGEMVIDLLQDTGGGVGAKISYIIDRNPFPAVFHGISVEVPDFLRKEKEKVFCIVAMKQYHQEIENYLIDLGYAEFEDYFFLFHKPMIIEQEQPYTDAYGNIIVGKQGTTVSITAYNCRLNINSDVDSKAGIYACNSSITIDENVIIKDGNIYSRNQSCIHLGSKGIFENTFDLVCYDNSYISIGEGTRVDAGSRIICGDNSKIIIGCSCRLNLYDTLVSTGHSVLQIGNYCSFQRFLNCSTTFEGVIEIEDEFMCSHYVSIYNNDGHPIYDITNNKQINRGKKIYIGKHVWAGIKSTILSGAYIGSTCIIGANSVVNKKFSNNCIIAGIPAKVIRKDMAWEVMETEITKSDKKYWKLTEIINE